MIRNIASGVRLGRMTGAMRRAVSSFVICHSSLIIALTALAACSSDSGEEQRPVEPTPEPVVSTEVAISFSGHEDEEKAVDNGSTRAETRAGTPLSEFVTLFNVWGYKNMEGGLQEVFPGYTVKWLENSAATTTTNSSGWEYILLDPADQTIKYWDWAAEAYRFFACAEVAGGGTVTVGKTDGHTDRFTMNVNCSDDDGDGTPEEDEVIAANMAATPFFSHLWFSTDALPTYADKRFGKPVQLEFLKPYARVRFIFKYSYVTEGIKLTDKEFKPTNGDEIYRKGTFTVTYPLTGAATSESFSVTPTPVADVFTAVENGTTLTDGKTYYTSSTGDSEFVSDGTEVADGTNYFALTTKQKLDAFTQDYVEDGNEKWYFVLPNNTQGSYTLSVRVNGELKTAVVPEEYMHWLPGYSYTYIFKILDLGGVEIEMVQSAVTPWTEMVANRTVYNW